ncbi:3,4-dihydroxy-2-butanone-4-phosphate synthase [Sinomonas sp. JGH33]|uniref:3,4-dihydroxy-2-butanone 4-phosphate synthase n=1 Tax=Sinomonas terricola TaxID=3110330 RepID=A0ABU5T2I5_9MICC|nr:3,4-dihydroxy-2-butanone-4-phosphate synthase [Sinomonas sp. JGH33]MEA5453704.1 3,4-dihydroxy-2-butanone-4-phosphate synthase [Sinomonas sp. JGH33]
MFDSENFGEALRDLRDGRIILIVDDADRENEGDLVAAAELVTGEQINFMAREARGLICVAVEQSIAEAKDLPQMVGRNEDYLGTAFTVSVDAAPEFVVTTGISAFDRAETIRVLLDNGLGPESLRRPGHMFPLVAHPAGVLGRRGHTEASTDLCTLAGLRRASVIVEVLGPDGRMARDTALKEFARVHGLTTVTVEDVVQARRAHVAWDLETAASK